MWYQLYVNVISAYVNVISAYVNVISALWRPWKHQEQEHSATDETENTLEIEERSRLVVFER